MAPLDTGRVPRHQDASHTAILLLDEHVVASTTGLELRFQAPDKFPTNPVLLKTEPWEGEGPYLWGNRLMHDPQTGQYRLWYAAFRHADNHYRWGYAVSHDGYHWEKPPLYMETFDGQPARNMLAGGPHPHKALRSLAWDPRPGCPPEQRYKAIRFTYDGDFASFSPDGIHWTEYPGNPIWHVPSDIIHTMWDPFKNTFVAYYKIWEVSGQQVDPKHPGAGYSPFRGYFPFYDTANHNGYITLTGPLVHFNPEGQAEVQQNFTVSLLSGGQGTDDGGGGMLRGTWTSKRVQCWAQTDDFIHWTNERVILRTDELDAPSANIQYMFVFTYGGYYFGILTMHDERGQFNQQLAISRDGLKWQRPWRGNFIGVGAPGTWESGMILGPVDPIVLEDRLLIYYGGFDIVHDSPAETFNSAIGYATLRRDGFASWSPSVASGGAGTLVTQPLPCGGTRILINAVADQGQVELELLDEQGQVIAGFDRANFRPMTTDALDAVAEWNQGASLADLAGRPIRLRFYLQHAALYAFRWGTI